MCLTIKHLKLSRFRTRESFVSNVSFVSVVSNVSFVSVVCKSHHSAGGICITLRAIASSGVFLQPNCLPRIAVQIPSAEWWDLHLTKLAETNEVQEKRDRHQVHGNQAHTKQGHRSSTNRSRQQANLNRRPKNDPIDQVEYPKHIPKDKNHHTFAPT